MCTNPLSRTPHCGINGTGGCRRDGAPTQYPPGRRDVMQDSMQQLDAQIRKLVQAGVFSSEEQAVDGIIAWLQELENDFIQQQMQQEDA